jgi:hypothetical protein
MLRIKKKQIMQIGFFNIFFINIELSEVNQLFINLFFKFYNSMEHFRLHLLIKKPLHTQ